jgi:hypothetical protein
MGVYKENVCKYVITKILKTARFEIHMFLFLDFLREICKTILLQIFVNTKFPNVNNSWQILSILTHNSKFAPFTYQLWSLITIP